MSRLRILRSLERLNERDRRAVTLGAILLVPAFLYLFAFTPYRTALAQAREQLAQEQELLIRELALIDAGPSLPATIEHFRQKAEIAESRMVSAPSEILAEAEIADELEFTAAAARVLLEEIQRTPIPRGEEAPSGVTVVRLTVSGESDLEGVLTFLDGVERHGYLMRVRGLALEPEMERPGRGDDEDEAREPRPTGVVQFQMIVEGYATVHGPAGQ